MCRSCCGQDDETPLHKACRYRRFNTARLPIRAGADPKAENHVRKIHLIAAVPDLVFQN